jgi:hypothetical protein
MSRMRILKSRMRAGVAIVAGCLLVACQTPETPIGIEKNLSYGPAPRSTLVGRQDIRFLLARERKKEVMTTVLAYQAPGGKPSPVAVMSASGADGRSQVSVRRLPLAAPRNEHGDLSVATLEYLYTLVLRQDPEARFCFADIGHDCDAALSGYSHAEMLQQLARSRQQAVAARGGASIPWQRISLTPANMHHADHDDVFARISGEHGPFEGATIFFNRAPHSSCQAKSNEAGIASCRLVDQHGDEDSHSGQEKAPVLAIFPGDVRADRVLLPTTLMQQPLP